MNRANRPLSVVVVAALGAAGALAGCGSPNRPNIALRKKVQELEGEIVQLKRQHEADRATIVGMTQRVGSAPMLPPERLEQLFTVHGIKLGRLTGGADLDPSKPGDEGLKVYVNLVDQHGDELKSSGSFVIEAFDLAEGPGGMRLGRWEFPVEQSQANWHSFLMRYEYVLTCPWQDKVPRHSDVTVKVTFNDELTGRQFTAQQVVRVNPPPAPSSAPSPSPGSATQPTANLR